MNTIDYLKELYGYGVPIFLNKIKIGGKSKTSIRKELSRAVKSGKINRKENGVYSFENYEDLNTPILSIEKVIEQKYVKNDHGLPGLDIDIYGYYSGQTFLHYIGLSQQVPATLEITTNNTSCKRSVTIGHVKIILRKGKTTIDRLNHKALQFFDLLASLDDEEIEENKALLTNYISKNFTKRDYINNIKYYPIRVNKIVVERGFIYAFK